MLLDEPFGALDGITRAQVQQWLLDVRIIDIDLPRPRSLDIEESPAFAGLGASVREALRSVS